MIQEVLFAGFGGQGIMLMGKLLAYGAMYEGFEVTFYPSYGPEMRGGTANCTVIISNKRIGSPIKCSFSLLMAMNQPSIDKFTDKIKPDGVLAYDANLNPPNRSDLRLWPIPISILASEIGTVQISNLVALGGLLPMFEMISQKAIIDSLSFVIPAHRQNMLELNREAIERGYKSTFSQAQSIRDNRYGSQ